MYNSTGEIYTNIAKPKLKTGRGGLPIYVFIYLYCPSQGHADIAPPLPSIIGVSIFWSKLLRNVLKVMKKIKWRFLYLEFLLILFTILKLIFGHLFGHLKRCAMFLIGFLYS